MFQSLDPDPHSYPYAGIRLDMEGIEQLSINAMHRMHDASTLLTWIHGEGLPEDVVHEVIETLCPDGSRHWSDIYGDLLLGVSNLTVPLPTGKTHEDLSFSEARSLLFAHWRKRLSQYEEALKLTLPPDLMLSGYALALYGHLLREYIYRGDVRSGRRFSAVHASLQLSWIGGTAIAETAIQELERLSLVQREILHAGGVDPTYELTYPTRASLFTHFHLAETYWTSLAFRDQREREIAAVMAHIQFSSPDV